jgi:hypothetical protein
MKTQRPEFMNMQKTARQGDKDLIKEHPKTEAHQHHQHNQHNQQQHNHNACTTSTIAQ